LRTIQQHKRTPYWLICIGFILFGAIFNQPLVAAENASEVRIEAEGGIEYDPDQNTSTASKNVVLTSDTTSIRADRLIYNGNSGWVEAQGNVILTTTKGVYRTSVIKYNIKNKAGSLSAFTGVLDGADRDYNISGSGLELLNQTGTVKQPAMTRCSKKRPDYLLIAKRIIYNERQVHLEKVKLQVKRVTVFYLPSLTFRIDNRNIPQMEAGYDNNDGFKLKWESFTPVGGKERWEWRFRSELKTKGDSYLGIGLGTEWKAGRNRLDFLYYSDAYWGVEDHLTFNLHNLTLTVETFQYFATTEKREFGLRATYKTWTTPIGNWQAELLGRRVTALDAGGVEYGGTYWGTRLNYTLGSRFSLSYLWLDSLEDSPGGYRDFLEDYRIGNNILYNWQIPLGQLFSFGLEGGYNSSGADWIHRSYRVTYESCCFKNSVGWDEIERNWEFRFQLKL
jgi:hypothetical protein